MPKIAAFGGAYANPYALEAMLVDARARGCERIFSLGDLGGFGAECDAVWPLLSAHGVECVAGNYDIAIGRGDPDCGCGYSDPHDNEFAQQMYDYTRSRDRARRSGPRSPRQAPPRPKLSSLGERARTPSPSPAEPGAILVRS